PDGPFVFLVSRRPAKFTLLVTLFPYTPLFRPATPAHPDWLAKFLQVLGTRRSEEHTSELQSLPTISYAVFCLKKKKQQTDTHSPPTETHKTTSTSQK